MGIFGTNSFSIVIIVRTPKHLVVSYAVYAFSDRYRSCKPSSPLRKVPIVPQVITPHLQSRSDVHVVIAFDSVSINSTNSTLSAFLGTSDKLPTQPSNHVSFLNINTIAVALPVAIPIKSSRTVGNGTNLINITAEL